MFTLDDDTGEITIDFTRDSDGAAEPEVVKVVVAPPKSFGAFKRIRGEIERINRGRDELYKTLLEDQKIGPNELTSRTNAYIEDHLLEWWRFVMIGDDSYRGQVVGDVKPPDSFDAWPLYLITNEALNLALTHWKTVPLARGAQPARPTS